MSLFNKVWELNDKKRNIFICAEINLNIKYYLLDCSTK